MYIEPFQYHGLFYSLLFPHKKTRCEDLIYIMVILATIQSSPDNYYNPLCLTGLKIPTD